MQIVQHHPAVLDPGRDSLADGLRLLHNLLEHEVGIAALFRRGYIPVHHAVLFLHRHQFVVEHINGVCRQHGDLSVVHVGHIPGVLDDGRDVGGNEVAVFSIAQNQRTVLPGSDECVGVIRADDAEGIGPLDPPQHTAHGLQHIMALVIVVFQQLGHYLRVCVGLEGDA